MHTFIKSFFCTSQNAHFRFGSAVEPSTVGFPWTWLYLYIHKTPQTEADKQGLERRKWP